MSVSSSLHVLVDEPVVEFNPHTYPSVIVRDAKPVDHGRFTLSLTGDRASRQAFVRALRAAADDIEAWLDTDEERAGGLGHRFVQMAPSQRDECRLCGEVQASDVHFGPAILLPVQPQA